MSASASNIDPGGGRVKQERTIARRREQAIRTEASPERYQANFNSLYPTYYEAMRPGLARANDALSLGSKEQTRAFNADLARRGYSTSGLGFYGRQSIEGGRQAGLNENSVRAYEEALRNAAQAAGTMQQLQVQGIMGAPIEPAARYHWAWNPAGAQDISFSYGGYGGA